MNIVSPARMKIWYTCVFRYWHIRTRYNDRRKERNI